MMDAVTVVAVVQDGNKVNACAIFGDLIFCKLSIKQSLEAAPKQVADFLRDVGRVRIMEPQYIIDGRAELTSNSVFVMPLQDFLADDFGEDALAEEWRPYRRMLMRLRKEEAIEYGPLREDPEVLAELRAQLEEVLNERKS